MDVDQQIKGLNERLAQREKDFDALQKCLADMSQEVLSLRDIVSSISPDGLYPVRRRCSSCGCIYWEHPMYERSCQGCRISSMETLAKSLKDRINSLSGGGCTDDYLDYVKSRLEEFFAFRAGKKMKCVQLKAFGGRKFIMSEGSEAVEMESFLSAPDTEFMAEGPWIIQRLVDRISSGVNIPGGE